MRSHQVILIALGLTLLGCGRTSERESRFLKDRSAVIEIVRRCFEQPYEGLSRWMPKDVPSNLDFPGEDHIRTSARSRTGWHGDDQWEVIYRPAARDGEAAGRPLEVGKLLEFYFSKLEAAGFSSGVRGIPVTSTETMHAASKSWANDDRTLLVTAYVVSDKRSGETIITTILRETLNR